MKKINDIMTDVFVYSSMLTIMFIVFAQEFTTGIRATIIATVVTSLVTGIGANK